MQCQRCHREMTPDEPIYRRVRGVRIFDGCAACSTLPWSSYISPPPSGPQIVQAQWWAPSPCGRCGRPVIHDLRRKLPSTSRAAASAVRRSIGRMVGASLSFSPASSAPRRSDLSAATPAIARRPVSRKPIAGGPFRLRRIRSNVALMQPLPRPSVSPLPSFCTVTHRVPRSPKPCGRSYRG